MSDTTALTGAGATPNVGLGPSSDPASSDVADAFRATLANAAGP